MNASKQGKVKAPILIFGLAIVAFFVFIGFEKNYDPLINITPPPSHATSTTSTPVVVLPPVIITPEPTSTIPVVPVVVVPPRVSGHSVGVAAGGGLSKFSTSTLNQELDQMVSAGIQWVRFDIEWGNIQYGSSKGANWYDYDKLVQALAAHHLKGLGIILFTPQWARTATCYSGVECPPADPTTFATFAAQVAARYKSYGMHYWEIWNEPNNFNFWAPKTDCAGYTDLLKAVYPAIKQADPNAVVVTGGLAPETTNDVNIAPTEFVSCMYKNGAKNYFDALGYHPYSFPQMPSAVKTGAWAQMATTNPSVRSIMVANGDADKKIWITEYGTPTNGPDPHWYVSEAQQSQMMTDAFALYKTYNWAGPFLWYTFKDGGTSTSTNENFFGITRDDATTKPAYDTLKSIISAGL